jgi:hypothetical protein
MASLIKVPEKGQACLLVEKLFGNSPTFWGMMDCTCNDNTIENVLESNKELYSVELREFLSLCLKTNEEDRPECASALLKSPFLWKYLSPRAVSLKQPRLRNMMLIAHFSHANIQNIVAKIVDQMRILQSKNGSVGLLLGERVDKLWPTWKLAHLALSFGVSYSFLVRTYTYITYIYI